MSSVERPDPGITQAADVGMGSFYNHFESKEQLLGAALPDALERLGVMLDEVTAGLDDPDLSAAVAQPDLVPEHDTAA